MRKPQLGGAGWRPLFTPVRTGVYVNDHCVVRAPDGRWHVFGITKSTPEIAPHQERWLCHGSGASLTTRAFKEHGPVCDFGARAWAPTVAFDGERWVMLYGPDRLRAAVCDDPRLEDWHEAPCSFVGGPLGAVLRDGMISLTYTTSLHGPADYHETLLFRSRNPFDFGSYSGAESETAARLSAHAAEYLVDPDTRQWYVTSAGWTGERFGTVIPGSVVIRELDWVG